MASESTAKHASRPEQELAEACRSYLRNYEELEEKGEVFRAGELGPRFMMRVAAEEMEYHIFEIRGGVM